MQNDDKYRPPAPNVGDRVSLTDGGVTRFAGKVTETTETPNIITVTAYDECYYLNKSKVDHTVCRLNHNIRSDNSFV